MIVALFCVAAAMIAGGVWAVLTGWEFIIIERGWTQVLLGGMLLTGGVLLGGLGVLAIHVKRLAGRFDRIRELSGAHQGSGGGAQVTGAEMPQPPPREEAGGGPLPKFEQGGSEPSDEPAADHVGPAEKQAAPQLPAPVAIAAGAGTAAVASALLVSTAKQDAQMEGGAAELISEAVEERSREETAEERQIPEERSRDATQGVLQVDDIGQPGLSDEAGTMRGSEEEKPLVAAEIRACDAPPETDNAATRTGMIADTVPETISETETQAGPASADEQLPETARWARSASAEPQITVVPQAPVPVDQAEGDDSEPVEQAVADGGVADGQEPPEPPQRFLVGTYESGGNVYTMYSDGSIDAKTPSGDFRFASLEELKNFIAEGGEDPRA